MDTLKWLIPALIVIFILGKVAEILRAMRGSLEEDLEFLQAGINDVEAKRTRMRPGREPIPADAQQAISGLLTSARTILQECRSQLAGASYRQRLALRSQCKQGIVFVKQARSNLRMSGYDDDEGGDCDNGSCRL
jgi:hypothetical protein